MPKTKLNRRTAVCSTRLLAERITTYLFTPGGTRKKAERLALMFDGRDICGWGYGPATDAVERILEEANNPDQRPGESPKTL